MIIVMQKRRNEKKSKRSKLLEMMINAAVAGKSGKITSRLHLTETEEENLRKEKQKRNKSDIEREHDIAK